MECESSSGFDTDKDCTQSKTGGKAPANKMGKKFGIYITWKRNSITCEEKQAMTYIKEEEDKREKTMEEEYAAK